MSDDPMAVCCRKLANSQHIIETKNAEIAALKEAIRRLAEQDATLSVQGGNVTVTMDATLTAEEREAVAFADAYIHQTGCRNTSVQKTLRGLLERTSGTHATPAQGSVQGQ